jgi:hypothetical protein
MEYPMIKAVHITTSRRALLAGAPAVAATALTGGSLANGLATALAAPSNADPVLAALAEYKAAVRATGAELEEFGEPTVETFNEEWDAFGRLFETTPTSIAGVAALLELLGTDEEGSGSPLAWAHNSGAGIDSPEALAADELMLRLAETLRSLIAAA